MKNSFLMAMAVIAVVMALGGCVEKKKKVEFEELDHKLVL